MNRDTALRLVEKLRALTVERGATGPEAALAAEKAAALVARFGLDPLAGRFPEPPIARAARPAPAANSPDWVGGQAFGGPQAGRQQAWRFDPASGKASSNVKVHRNKGRWDWKIEIMPD